MKKIRMWFARLGCAIGNGLLAGFAGTLAITLSQMAEMAFRKRTPSQTPAQAFAKVFSVRPENEASERRLTQYVHLGYGTSWGIFRGLLDMLRIRRLAATGFHWTAVQTVAMTVLPALKVTPPVKEWGRKEIAVEMAHHLVYAGTTGLVYEALALGSPTRTKIKTRPGLGIWSAVFPAAAWVLFSMLGKRTRNQDRARSFEDQFSKAGRLSNFQNKKGRFIVPDVVRPGDLTRPRATHPFPCGRQRLNLVPTRLISSALLGDSPRPRQAKAWWDALRWNKGCGSP